MTRRIKWDRKVVERARDLAESGMGAAEVRDELQRERGIEIPYHTVVDWLRFDTRNRPPDHERGNLDTGTNSRRMRRTAREQRRQHGQDLHGDRARA